MGLFSLLELSDFTLVMFSKRRELRVTLTISELFYFYKRSAEYLQDVVNFPISDDIIWIEAEASDIALVI